MSTIEIPYPPMARRVIAYVLDNFAEEIGLEELATHVSMTRYNFCRRFAAECGVTPMRWLWSFRTLLARELITIDPAWSLTDVAFACGFTSSAHFSRSFRQTFSESPSTYRLRMLRDEGQRPARRFGASRFNLGDDRELVLRTALAALAVG